MTPPLTPAPTPPDRDTVIAEASRAAATIGEGCTASHVLAEELLRVRARLAAAEKERDERLSTARKAFQNLQAVLEQEHANYLEEKARADAAEKRAAAMQACVTEVPDMCRRIRNVAEFYPGVEMCEGDEQAASMAWDVLNESLERAEAALAALEAAKPEEQ